MKEKIFEGMRNLGWDLDFDSVYDYHYESIMRWYDKTIDEKHPFEMNDICKDEFIYCIEFMSDFLTVLNELNEEDA